MQTCRLCLIYLIIQICIFQNTALAQEFGGNPIDIQWQEINTDTVRVIFPKGLEQQALRVANILHELTAVEKRTIGNRHLKIDVVLQNQTLESNGYVGLAPWRSEYFMNPFMDNQFLGTIPWHETLALHEYRHVLQFSNSRVGLSKLAYFLFGQSGWAGASFLATPNWFWEGDAVHEETRLSTQGRGRLPYFLAGMQGLANKGTIYRYMKARNGSFRSFVPNHYPYGYILLWYGTKTYGDTLWRTVFKHSNQWRGIIYPFSRALHKQTGLHTKTFYKRALRAYKKTIDSINATSIETNAKQFLPNDTRTVTEQRQVYIDSENNPVLYIDSYKKIGAFISVSSELDQKVITRPGLTNDRYFSMKDNLFTWAEERFHERRGYQNYSVIMTYNSQTNEKKQITHKTRFLAPDISNSGKQIVVAEATSLLKYQLVVIDATTGTEISRIDNPDGYFYTYPRWSNADTCIYSPVRNTKGEMALMQIYPDGRHIPLIPFISQPIGHPYVSKSMILFSAAFNGSDEIYALLFSNNKVYRLTNRHLNVYYPSANADESTLYFTEVSKYGSLIYEMPFRNVLWEKTNVIPATQSTNYMAFDTSMTHFLESVPNRNFRINKYNEFKHLINIHSWVPILSPNQIGLSVRSDNIVNTISAQASTFYSSNDYSWNHSLGVSYAQLYPVFSLQFEQVTDRHRRYLDTTTKLWRYDSTIFNSANIGLGVSFPFNLSSGLYVRRLNISESFFGSHVYYTAGKSLMRNPTGQQSTIGFQRTNITFQNLRKRAVQNSAGIWSHYVNHTFEIASNATYQYHGELDFSLPGAAPNHIIILMAAYQQRNYTGISNPFLFTDRFIYPRGLNNMPMYADVSKFSFNYYLNLAYPDFGLANIIYFKRLRLNILGDYAVYNNTSVTSSADSPASIRPMFQNSTGLEFIFDLLPFNIRNFVIPFSFGILYTESEYQNALINQNGFNFYVGVPIIRL